MRGRGMAVVLIPNLGGQLIQCLTRHIAIISLKPVDPNHQLMAFFRRECQHTFFQFRKAHREITLPQKQAYFKANSGFVARLWQLPLEIVSKGRFEKSEPTIHHGENLDVPTYIRRGVWR